MDPQTLLAIALVGLMWFGWQYYLQQKYPDAYQAKESPAATETKTMNQNNAQQNTASVGNSKKEGKPLLDETKQVKAEKTFKYISENFNFTLSSKGMSLRNISLNQYTDREGKTVIISPSNKFASTHLLQTHLINSDSDETINFDVVEKKPGVYIGRYVSNGMEIEKILEVDPERYTVSSFIKVSKMPSNFRGIRIFLTEKMDKKSNSGSIIMPEFARQEAYISYQDTDNRIPVAEDETIAADEKSYLQVNLLALSSHYFATAFIDSSVLMPEAQIEQNKVSGQVIAQIDYKPINQINLLELKSEIFIGPKSITLLEKVDENLGRVINFGIFHSLAVPMLKLMNWFFEMFGNYGLAIILLTLVVRTVVLPFNLMSYKSMKAMQKIQPKIKEIREKYKQDPKKLNQETMLLMKQNKANPMGGCLPMLLQFPVFIALYQVFGQSIELYQAPFIFWITDLSLKDPYFILPVAMGVTMFLQQKMTPTTMDPTQAKIMMFMPIMFTAFMLFLPSALTLYIFTSTLYAVIQQMLFMRDKKNTKIITTTARA